METLEISPSESNNEHAMEISKSNLFISVVVKVLVKLMTKRPKKYKSQEKPTKYFIGDWAKNCSLQKLLKNCKGKVKKRLKCGEDSSLMKTCNSKWMPVKDMISTRKKIVSGKI